MLDDRSVGDELHQDSTIRQLISNSASGCSSAASQILLTNAATSLARTRSPAGVGRDCRALINDGRRRFWHGYLRTGERGSRNRNGSRSRLPRPLPEQGDRLVAGLAQRGGKGYLVLIAAGGLAERRDDEGLVDVVARGGKVLEHLPVHLAQSGGQPFRAVQVRVVEGVVLLADRRLRARGPSACRR